jgi:mono/diheme cytochrome c family protein
MRRIRLNALLVFGVLALTACGSGDYSGGTAGVGDGGTGGSGGGGGGGQQFANDQEFFAARVAPSMDFCRTCHVPNGVADTEEGRRFQLSSSKLEDYAKLKASWIALDRGVESNKILIEPTVAAEPHSGGKPWPASSDPYKNMKLLLQCWDNPTGCAALLGGVVGGGGGGTDPLPLLGNPGKHFFVNQICDGAPDSTPIDWSKDPRLLLQNSGFAGSANLIDSEQFAVHFNDPFEVCHNDTLFQNQAEQNALRKADGKEEIYSARPYAATCGEWRTRVQEGHDFIAMYPTDSPRPRNADGTLGYGDGHNVGDNFLAGGFSSASAKSWSNLWKVWGLSARPANFDQQVSERYGHSPTPDHIYNPYPLPGEEAQLSTSFGGTGKLPLGWAQGRDAQGKYNGEVGITCFSCHAGQIGAGEIASRDGIGNAQSYGGNAYGSFMGLPNTNTELGVLIADLLHVQVADGVGFGQPSPLPAIGYIPVVNTTRGTNAADTEIELIVAIRDFDTLEFSHVLTDPAHGSMGDQDPPAWWWLHNKTRYLWFGGHSTDSSRGNMYFGSVNGLSGAEVKKNENLFESVHDWSLTVEAPSYPGAVNTALAEQGAILFHEKNLWAEEGNSDIPKPKGNGACAGCHGAYSPRYANDTRFLPDPKLAGTTGYTVPIEIIDTDPAQAEGWARTIREHVSTFWWSYPDANEDYLFPELKDPLTELLDDYAATDGISGASVADQFSRNFDRSGLLQPLSDLLRQAGQQLSPVTGLPLGQTLGRVKGACSFEEKTVGYVTPPLHGVWASAPYFHNGSVPNVWSVLKPEDRPKVWRRQSKTTPNVAVNAFEHALADNTQAGVVSSYDFTKLGWKHDVLVCGDLGQGIPYYTCQGPVDVPAELQWLYYQGNGGFVWPTWIVPPPVGEQGLEDRKIVNHEMYSKRNTGHEFTKVLTDAERLAIMEYLKTL